MNARANSIRWTGGVLVLDGGRVERILPLHARTPEPVAALDQPLRGSQAAACPVH